MGRHSCCYKQKLRKGLWSPQEDEKLLRHITQYGHGCWSTVPKLAGLQRCGKSCRLRWINYLRPDLKRGSFSQEEENLIIELHAALGNKWSQIAAQFSGRTDNEIKNLWNSSLKKKLRQRGIDPNTHKPLSEVENKEDQSKPSINTNKTTPKFSSNSPLMKNHRTATAAATTMVCDLNPLANNSTFTLASTPPLSTHEFFRYGTSFGFDIGLNNNSLICNDQSQEYANSNMILMPSITSSMGFNQILEDTNKTTTTTTTTTATTDASSSHESTSNNNNANFLQSFSSWAFTDHNSCKSNHDEIKWSEYMQTPFILTSQSNNNGDVSTWQHQTQPSIAEVLGQII